MNSFERNDVGNRKPYFILGLAVCAIFIISIVVGCESMDDDESPVIATKAEHATDENLSDYQDTLVWQHLKICEMDTEQLALDLVYIDHANSTFFVRDFIRIGNEEPKEEVSNKQKPIPFDGYDQKDFKKLCKTLDSDSDVRSLAMQLVKEYIGYDEEQLPVPDQGENRYIRSLLENSWTELMKPQSPRIDGGPDKPSGVPDNPKPEPYEETE